MRVSLLALSSALILAACSSAQTDETGQTASSTASATSTKTGEGANQFLAAGPSIYLGGPVFCVGGHWTMQVGRAKN